MLTLVSSISSRGLKILKTVFDSRLSIYNDWQDFCETTDGEMDGYDKD